MSCNNKIFFSDNKMFRHEINFADFLHGLTDELSDVRVPVRRDSSDLSDLRRRHNRLGVRGEVRDDVVESGLGTSAEVHRVASCCYVLHTFRVDGPCEDCSGGRAINGIFVCLWRSVLNKTLVNEKKK
jgi:hypothetical protein